MAVNRNGTFRDTDTFVTIEDTYGFSLKLSNVTKELDDARVFCRIDDGVNIVHQPKLPGARVILVCKFGLYIY